MTNPVDKQTENVHENALDCDDVTDGDVTMREVCEGNENEKIGDVETPMDIYDNDYQKDATINLESTTVRF